MGPLVVMLRLYPRGFWRGDGQPHTPTAMSDFR